MSRLMLINGQQPEELRVAIVTEGTLESYQVEIAESGLKRGNIYRGVVANIEPSLDAAFIDFGQEKHGFLTVHDVVPQAYHRQPPAGERRPRLDQLLQKGRPIIVQVTRDAVGSKGAALTTNLSFPGRYLVLLPYEAGCGVSRKVEDDALRDQLKEKAKSLALPQGYGCIVRTNAVDQTKTALKADVAALMRLCKRVLHEGGVGSGSRLLYDDQDLVVQALRDYLDASVEEVVVDEPKLFERAQAYVDATMPRSKLQLTAYQGRVPLFSRYNIEGQIETIYKRVVPMSSGGSIVIDHTEALTAIDVNSGRDTRGATQEETARNTNLAAVSEVARQLRLRDIGGLVVVDLIDMRSSKHRAAVEKALKDALKVDKARTRVGRISSNGLIEINRQRLKQALGQRMHRTCPTCEGAGMLPTQELVGLRLLRRIEARAATGWLRKVRVLLHPELADAIQNRRRRQIAALELKYEIAVEIVAAPQLHRVDEQLEWVNREGAAQTVPVGEERAPSTGSQERTGRRRSRRRGRNREERGGLEPAASASTVLEGVPPELEEEGWDDESEGDQQAEREHEAESDAVVEAVGQPDSDESGELEATASGTAEAGSEPEATRRRRRRRRGGRRRRKSNGLAAVPTQVEEGETSADDAAEELPPEQDEHEAPTDREPDASGDREADVRSAEGDASEASSPDESSSSSRSRRRRRPRRRGPRRGAEAADTPAPEDTGTAQETEDSE